MNDNTEVRDELARLAFWCKPDPERGRRFWYNEKTAKHSADHPIPNTLDEASKLPDGWVWDCIELGFDNEWYALARKDQAPERLYRGTYGRSETAVRFLVRLAVEKIEHERRGGQP